MIYASITASIGIALFVTSAVEGWKWVGAIGIALYFVGLITGNIIEDRLEKRIKELEKKSKEV